MSFHYRRSFVVPKDLDQSSSSSSRSRSRDRDVVGGVGAFTTVGGVVTTTPGVDGACGRAADVVDGVDGVPDEPETAPLEPF
jgi:hypothetical protein